MKSRSVAVVVLGVIAAAAGPSAVLACSAPAPSPGSVISGPVLAVPNSQTICVATGPRPAQWVALNIAEHGSDPSVSLMMAAVFAKRVSCVVGSGNTARCVVGDKAVSQVLRQPALQTAALTWR